MIEIRDSNQELIDELKMWFDGNKEISCRCADIFDGDADAVVSPANSFGFMDGGIDYVYLKRWPDIQFRVQQAMKHRGRLLLPGESLEVETGEPHLFRGLIVLPTMIAPMSIVGSTNVFLAFYELCRNWAFKDHSYWRIACPGLGTGVGRMTPRHAAKQMAAAYQVASETAGVSEWRRGSDSQYYFLSVMA